MNVVVRADASHAMGHGHVMRTLALANALRARGAAVSFVCREHSGHLSDVIDDQGFPLFRVRGAVDRAESQPPPAHAAWLGARWQDDAEATKAAIEASGTAPAWLVVDHYALDHRWEESLRPLAGRLMVVDDLADRPHACDLLVDPTPAADAWARYAGRVPLSCDLRLGLEYALLQSVYAGLRGGATRRHGPVRRMLIFFGGADHDNMTGRSVSAFLRLQRPDIDVDIVLAPHSPHAGALSRQISGLANMRLHVGLPTLAHLASDADLALGAGGVASLERVCLGLPSLVVTTAENQRRLAAGLRDRGLIRLLGHKDEVDEALLTHALADAIERGVDADWSARCLAAVDGRGADRISDVMMAAVH